jgi:hypothetical protein
MTSQLDPLVVKMRWIAVREGYVGVYWRGGALLNHISEPGYHVKMPFVTTMAEVQVTVQTDSVNNIPCGTSGGVLIHVGCCLCHVCVGLLLCFLLLAASCACVYVRALDGSSLTRSRS